MWTTNFDRLIEDAHADVFKTTTTLRTATPSDASIAESAVNEGSYPLLTKLHGDFHSTRLKNTRSELQEQDRRLRTLLVRSCSTNGLAVVGYSGRDDSILEALEQAAGTDTPFPGGIFWFHRADSPPSPRVQELLSRVRAVGADASAIQIETFDELMMDIARNTPNFPNRRIESKERLVGFPLPASHGTYPVLRLNAVPIVAFPTMCKLVDCDIGGTAEVREAVKEANVELIVARTKLGVLAFGPDKAIRGALSAHNWRSTQLHEIDSTSLVRESSELGLLYDGLCRAIEQNLPLRAARVGRRRTFVPTVMRASTLAPLKKACGALSGTIPKTKLEWLEAVELRIEFRFGQLWLILHPTLWAPATDDEAAADHRGRFIREQLAARYNRRSNAIIDAWAKVLTGSGKLGMFPDSDPELCFELGAITAFSWRAA